MKNALAEWRSAIVADEKIEVLCLFYTLIDADYNPNTATSHSSRQRSVMSTSIHTHTIVSQNRAHGWCMLLCALTRGWVTSLHFTAKKRPCLHYLNLQQDISHQHTCPVQVQATRGCAPPVQVSMQIIGADGRVVDHKWGT